VSQTSDADSWRSGGDHLADRPMISTQSGSNAGGAGSTSSIAGEALSEGVPSGGHSEGNAG
jgi:hypothetical protein